jgi:hypothetical protein
MLNNYYVYETPDFLDLPHIHNLVMKKLETDFVKQGYVRINVNDDAYLKSVQERFSFLGEWLNIYHTRPQGHIPLHVDGHRLAAFNIPIDGCDETSQTIYYESATETPLEKVYKPDERHYRIRGEVREVYRFALTRPALIRNDVAHDVKRFGATKIRIIASWGVTGTFEQCRDQFEQILNHI